MINIVNEKSKRGPRTQPIGLPLNALTYDACESLMQHITYNQANMTKFIVSFDCQFHNFVT